MGSSEFRRIAMEKVAREEAERRGQPLPPAPPHLAEVYPVQPVGRKLTLAERLGLKIDQPVNVPLPVTRTTPREVPILKDKPIKPAIPVPEPPMELEPGEAMELPEGLQDGPNTIDLRPPLPPIEYDGDLL